MATLTKQQIILNYLQSNETITKSHATSLLKHFYYHNAQKYVGEMLSRMIKNGILRRVKRGVYAKGSEIKKVKQINNPNQLKLFANK